MELDRTVAAVSICTLLGVVAFVGMIATNWASSTKAEIAIAAKCIEGGGTWVPQRTEFRVCLRR